MPVLHSSAAGSKRELVTSVVTLAWASRDKNRKTKGEGFLDAVHITSDKDDNVHFVHI